MFHYKENMMVANCSTHAFFSWMEILNMIYIQILVCYKTGSLTSWIFFSNESCMLWWRIRTSSFLIWFFSSLSAGLIIRSDLLMFHTHFSYHGIWVCSSGIHQWECCSNFDSYLSIKDIPVYSLSEWSSNEYVDVVSDWKS